MVKNKIVRATAVAAASLGVVAGLSGIAGASSLSGHISGTGKNSSNKITSTNKSNVEVSNENKVFALNASEQSADSGFAGVFHNKTGGDATTGDAKNSNKTHTSVSVTNSMPGGSGGLGGSSSSDASIRDTGKNSNNTVKESNTSNVTVSNENNVAVVNLNEQSADSGSAVVAGNKTGGDATTGDASNTNSTTTTVTIKN